MRSAYTSPLWHMHLQCRRTTRSHRHVRAPTGGVTTASKESGTRALWFPVRNHRVPPGRAGRGPSCPGITVPSMTYAGAPGADARTERTVAQKIQTLFIDDIDGSPAEGTVRFALDGTSYEIDLSTGHAQALRAALSSLCRRGQARTRHAPPGPVPPQARRGRPGLHPGPGLGQEPGHRRQRPRPDTRRTRRQVQGRDRAVRPRSRRPHGSH